MHCFCITFNPLNDLSVFGVTLLIFTTVGSAIGMLMSQTATFPFSEKMLEYFGRDDFWQAQYERVKYCNE